MIWLFLITHYVVQVQAYKTYSNLLHLYDHLKVRKNIHMPSWAQSYSLLLVSQLPPSSCGFPMAMGLEGLCLYYLCPSYFCRGQHEEK